MSTRFPLAPRVGAAALAALSMMLVDAMHAQAAIDPCKNVDISVKNDHPSGDPIKVVYIDYYIGPTYFPYWAREGLSNKVPNPGNTVTWNNQDLSEIDEGMGTQFIVYFKRQLTGGWWPTYGDTRYQVFDRWEEECETGRSYFFTIDETGDLE